MKEQIANLQKVLGSYVGEGVNHEGQKFVGRLQLTSLLGGKGVQLKFSAIGLDGTIYHQEESTLAPSLAERLTLWNFNTNTPGLIPHELRSGAAKPGAMMTMVFGFNPVNDLNTFREEVCLDIWEQNAVSYTYSWGMPGGEFKERSGVRMSRQPEVNEC